MPSEVYVRVCFILSACFISSGWTREWALDGWVPDFHPAFLHKAWPQQPCGE